MKAVCSLDEHKDNVFLCIICDTTCIIFKVFGDLTYLIGEMCSEEANTIQGKTI